MDAILFFGMNVFEIKKYQSIECGSVQEIEKSLKENENVKFLVIPEERIGEVLSIDKNDRPIMICITKTYKSYNRGDFTPLLFSSKTAQKVIEEWQ